jgi:hypothetical protein
MKKKDLSLLFWKRKFISATVAIPKQVFVFGDNVLVSAEITNHGSVAVKNTMAAIKQIVTYRCSGRKKIKQSVVSEVKKGEVDPGTLFKWSEVPLPVPNRRNSVPPSDFGPRCRLFKVEHKLEVSASSIFFRKSSFLCIVRFKSRIGGLKLLEEAIRPISIIWVLVGVYLASSLHDRYGPWTRR